MGSTGTYHLELHSAVLWWLFVYSLYVYSCVYVYVARTRLLTFGDDEYWKASHYFFETL